MRLHLARDQQQGANAFVRFADEVHGRQRLTLVSASGARRSRAYFELREIEWNPDLSAIVLTLLDTRVTIHGRNLVGLCEMLEEHEVGLIQERHVREIELPQGATWVERIEWDPIG